ERRDLLAAKPGCPTSSAARKTDVLGLDALAALAQEVGELLAPALTVPGLDAGTAVAALVVVAPAAGAVRGVRLVGGDIYYQDKPLSCTWIRMSTEYITCLPSKPSNLIARIRRLRCSSRSAWPSSW